MCQPKDDSDQNQKNNGESPCASIDSPRRKFLKTAGIGAAAATVSPTLLAASSKAAITVTDNRYDVIVIGGGFAGVTAARDISMRGHRALILEARPRLGGRTFTSRFAGHDIDLGGTWFGNSQPFIWAEKMRYGLELAESAAANPEQTVWMNGDNRVVGDGSTYAQIYGSAAEAFYAPTREYLPRAFDPLFRKDFGDLDETTAAQAIDRLDLTQVQKDLLHSFAGINGHSFSDKSSYLDQLRWYALGDYDLWNMWDNLSRYRFAGGTKSLIKKMHADGDFETRLGTAISEVHQGGDKVIVTTTRGEKIEARSVVVAVPLNCIHDIKFSPSISKIKLDASRRGHTGSGTKVYAQVEGKNPVFIGHGKESMPLCFAWTEYNDARSQVVCGFGLSPSLLDVNDDDEIQAAFNQYMPGLRMSESVSYDWNHDPYSKGTWCMYPPGMLTSSLAELQRPEGNIFFAGADIANGWRGFIDGAIESGARTATQIDEHLSVGASA